MVKIIQPNKPEHTTWFRAEPEISGHSKSFFDWTVLSYCLSFFFKKRSCKYFPPIKTFFSWVCLGCSFLLHAQKVQLNFQSTFILYWLHLEFIILGDSLWWCSQYWYLCIFIHHIFLVEWNFEKYEKYIYRQLCVLIFLFKGHNRWYS